MTNISRLIIALLWGVVSASPAKAIGAQTIQHFQDDGSGTHPASSPFTKMKHLWENSDYVAMDRLWMAIASRKDSVSPGVSEKCRHLHLSSLLARRRYEEAIAGFDAFIMSPKEDSLRYHDVISYIGMSDIFTDLGERTLAAECLDKASGLMPLPVSTSPVEAVTSECQYHMARAKLLLSSESHTEAIRELDKADSLAITPALELSAIGLRAHVMESMGNSDGAHLYHLKGLSIPVENPNKAYILLNCLHYESIHNRPLEVFRLMEANSTLVEMINNDPRMRRGLLLIMSHTYEQLNAVDDANLCLKTAIHIEDSISAIENRLHDSFVDKRIDPDKYESLRRTMRHNDHVWLWIISIVSAMSLLLTAIHVITVRDRSKARRETARVRNLTEKRINDSVSHLQYKLDNFNREITQISMESARMSETLSSIRNETENSQRKPNENIRAIRRLIHETRLNMQSGEIFKAHFEQSNLDFFTRLSKLHPTLTKSETRMAGYIIMNLTDKEIANITNRSVRTVESVKYTLRKKLAITEPTAVYLRRIMSDSDSVTHT